MYRLIYTQFRWCALFIPLPYVNIFMMFIFVLGFFKKIVTFSFVQWAYKELIRT